MSKIKNSITQESKKVEYIELIYDLIFVYLLGRSSSLLERIEAGFISHTTVINYIANSLIFIQIWYSTTVYINRYGRNRLRDNLLLIANMFLLYIMGATTSHGWDVNYTAFAVSWALILGNLAVNYLLELKSSELCYRKHIIQNVILHFGQAVLLLLTIPLQRTTGYAAGAWTMVLGFIITPFLMKIPVDFGHLTERVMLYVVFTFGEMIVIISQYFSDGFNLETLYYSLMSFVIVAGLFYSYGFVYDHLLDREGERVGTAYMILHIFLILSLCFITTSLEFLRKSEVRDFPKTIMMLGSLLLYYGCLAMTEYWAKRRFRKRKRFIVILIAEFAVFSVMIFLSIGNGRLCIALMAALVCLQLLILFLNGKYTQLECDTD